jgi:murein DD-endopeptidase MepM/ murein hydrolase activator NlpD
LEAVVAAIGNWVKVQAIGFLRRHWPKIVGAVTLIALFWTMYTVGMVAVLTQNDDTTSAAGACREIGYSVDPAAYEPAPVGQTPTIPTGGEVPGFSADEGEQLANARAIVAAGSAAGVGKRGMIVAIATALQESGLSNVDYGDRDSLGLFQQRPSQGWGTPAEVRDPDFASRAFYGGPRSPHFNKKTKSAEPPGLLEVAGWEQMSVTVAAQRVQRSAFPDAYAKHEARARVIVDALTDPSTPDGPSATAPSAPAGDGAEIVTAEDFRSAGVDLEAFCSENFDLVDNQTPAEPGQVIPAGQWTAPIQTAITSEFGNRFHPVYKVWRLHAGTDFHAPVGTPIAAPSVGVVRAVTWDAGGGLMVDITHADGVMTRHLHLSQALVTPGQEVQGGQTIALSGNTGTGTAAHYHFETHVDGNPVDPVGFMAGRGVDLRSWS